MKIEILKEQNYQESIKLSEYAFQYEVPEEELKSRLERLKTHHILGIFDPDSPGKSNLAAKLHILPLKVNIAGKEWEMGGIAGVATYPEFRRKGYVRKLIMESLHEMNKANQTVSFLHPFDIGFYRKFGWELISDIKRLTIKKEELRQIEAPPGTIKRFRKEDHSGDIERVYSEFAARFSGTLARNRDWWLNHVYSSLTAALYHDYAGHPRGYILYNVKNHFMEIHEYVALDSGAKRNLWNFICQHDSMVDRVKLHLPAADTLNYLLRNPKQENETHPYFMGRIVNAESFLQEYPLTVTEEKVFLHVHDVFAGWNNGTYLLHKEKVSFYKSKEAGACSHPPQKGLTLGINELTAILLGYKRPMELYELGLIQGTYEEAAALERKVPIQQTLFYDFF